MTRFGPILVVCLALAACSGNDTATGSSSTVEVLGTLVSIVDRVPVDGGLTLEVEGPGGTRTEFHIPSFFTPEPVPEGRWELYRHAKTFRVGNIVRATGVPTEHGLLLTSLEHAIGR